MEIPTSGEAQVSGDRRWFLGWVGRGVVAKGLSAPAVGVVVELLAGCGDDGDNTENSLSAEGTGNTLEATGDLESGQSETVEGSFVTDGEVHCHYHDDMTLDVVVDHTATTEVGQEPRTVEVSMTDNAFGPEEVHVGHAEDVSFAFTNDGRVVHNAMLSDSTQAGGAHAGH